MGVKKQIGERFRIDRAQILLVGFDAGAHYAAYLGMKYPEEFSAAVLFREAWAGPFEKIIRLNSDPRKRISFFLALDPESDLFSRTETKALEFEKKGYVVKLETLKKGEAEAILWPEIIQWFLNDVESRTILKEKPKVTFKEKFKGAVHNFFEV